MLWLQGRASENLQGLVLFSHKQQGPDKLSAVNQWSRPGNQEQLQNQFSLGEGESQDGTSREKATYETHLRFYHKTPADSLVRVASYSSVDHTQHLTPALCSSVQKWENVCGRLHLMSLLMPTLAPERLHEVCARLLRCGCRRCADGENRDRARVNGVDTHNVEQLQNINKPRIKTTTIRNSHMAAVA